MVPLMHEERDRLRAALRQNGESQGGVALLMDKDTSFAGTRQVPENAKVISAVCSTPNHY